MTGNDHTIQAVSLDLDGTLYSIRRMVWLNLATILPLRRFFILLHQVRDQMRLHGPFEDYRAEQARRLAELSGLSDAQAQAWVEQVVDQRWMSVFERVRPFSGVLPCLKQLSQRGVRLAICSDYPVRRKLFSLGLHQLPFQVVVNSERTGALKPHLNPFRAVIDGLSCEPNRILHVGDLEKTDVVGALDAGMRVARFHEGFRRPDTAAEFTFRRWSRFIPLLRKRNMIDF